MSDKEILKQVVKEVFDEEFKPLYIDRERHYRDHLIISDIDSEDVVFLKNLRLGLADLRTTTIRALVRVVIPGTVVLIVAGIVSYLKFWKPH